MVVQIHPILEPTHLGSSGLRAQRQINLGSNFQNVVPLWKHCVAIQSPVFPPSNPNNKDSVFKGNLAKKRTRAETSEQQKCYTLSSHSKILRVRITRELEYNADRRQLLVVLLLQGSWLDMQAWVWQKHGDLWHECHGVYHGVTKRRICTWHAM